MRWVILSDDWVPGPGGVASWSWGAAEGLASAGARVHVFARARRGLTAPDGVTVHGVRPWSGRFAPGLLAARAALDLARADAVLATTWTVATAVAPLAARRGLPLHVVFHGSDATRPPRRPEAFRRVVAAARHRWAVSRFLVDELAGRGVPARWVPSPVRVGPDAFDPEGPWLLVARATPLKGGDRFVRWVAAAGADGAVIGDGPELGAWRALADRLGARIRFVGAVDRAAVQGHLVGAALVALAPRPDADGTGSEGLGLALLEARARGLLPVGCRVGGVPEAVGSGLILDDPDEVGGSVAAIRATLADWRPERARVGLEVHGVDRVAAALLG